jgi:DNA-binding transcriptional LysR family regulator
MQLEALKVYCDVARNRSFSQAAVANDVTQSAVSQIIAQLERRLGARLIDRSVRPLELTAAGQRYYEGCKELLEHYLDLEAAIRAGQPEELAASVQVAAIYSVGLRDMGQYVDHFHALAPDSSVHIEYVHPDQVYEKVQNGTADLGLVSFPRQSRKLAALPWRDEEMGLACAPDHPLGRSRRILPDDLKFVRFVHFEKGLAIRREIDRFLRENDVAVDVVMEFDNIENIKRAVEAGAGVGLLPLPTYRREVESGTLAAVRLADCSFVRPLAIIHRRHPRPNAASQRFIELLRHLDDVPGPANGDVRAKAHASGRDRLRLAKR